MINKVGKASEKVRIENMKSEEHRILQRSENLLQKYMKRFERKLDLHDKIDEIIPKDIGERSHIPPLLFSFLYFFDSLWFD